MYDDEETLEAKFREYQSCIDNLNRKHYKTRSGEYNPDLITVTYLPTRKYKAWQMLLCDASLGKVVFDPNDVVFKPKRVGHIIGFDVEDRDVIIVVRWCDGVEESVHPDVIAEA